MRKLAIALMFCWIAALAAGSSGSAGQEEGGPPKRYGVQSGIIDYVVSGSEPTYLKLYFDDWGMKTARHSIVQKPLIGVENILTIQNRDEIVTIDLGKRIATKKQDEEFVRTFPEYLKSGKATLSEYEFSSAQAQFVGEEEVAGLICEVWENREQGLKVWFWNWVPLKIVRDTPDGPTVSVATSFRENAAVSQDIFSVPRDIQFVEGNLEDILLSALFPRERALN